MTHLTSPLCELTQGVRGTAGQSATALDCKGYQVRYWPAQGTGMTGRFPASHT